MLLRVTSPFFNGLVDKSSSVFQLWSDYMEDVRKGRSPRHADKLKMHNDSMDRNNLALTKHVDNKLAGYECKCAYCLGNRDL